MKQGAEPQSPQTDKPTNAPLALSAHATFALGTAESILLSLPARNCLFACPACRAIRSLRRQIADHREGRVPEDIEAVVSQVKIVLAAAQKHHLPRYWDISLVGPKARFAILTVLFANTFLALVGYPEGPDLQAYVKPVAGALLCGALLTASAFALFRRRKPST